MALNDGVVKEVKKLVPSPSKWMRAYLLFRFGFFYLLGVEPKVVFVVYAWKGTCFQSVAIPYRGVDYVVLALAFPPSIFKVFGHKFVSIAEDTEIWNGEKNGVIE